MMLLITGIHPKNDRQTSTDTHNSFVGIAVGLFLRIVSRYLILRYCSRDNMEPIIEELRAVAQAQGLASIECAEFADYMDSVDPYRSVKDEFHFPPGKTRESKLYLCGNSLGLQPKSKFETLVVA
jgi:hypothetical protein